MNTSSIISVFLLSFFLPGSSGLNGSWKLTGIKYIGKHKSINRPQNQPDAVTIVFQDNGQTGKYSGSAMGQTFGANYEIKPGNKFSFSKSYTLSSDGSSVDDDSFYKLCDDSHFRISNNILSIICPGDTTEMVYERTRP
jgi:hypothetical protein